MYAEPVLLDTTPHIITSLLAMGMALAFIIADRQSPTSRALSLFLAAVGLAIGIGSQIAHPLHARGIVAWWDGLFAIPETLAFVFAYEWVLRVRRTVPAQDVRDQLLAEAPGQRARAKKEAVVDRAEGCVVQQLGIGLGAQLAGTHAPLQVGDRRIAPRTDPSVEVLP